MFAIEMYITIRNPRREKQELAEHPLLKLPYVTWGKCCDCLGHITVTMEDKYEYEYRELCMQYPITIEGDMRCPNRVEPEPETFMLG